MSGHRNETARLWYNDAVRGGALRLCVQRSTNNNRRSSRAGHFKPAWEIKRKRTVVQPSIVDCLQQKTELGRSESSRYSRPAS